MANLRAVLKKALSKAVAITAQLERAHSVYTPTSVLAKALQRIEDRICGSSSRSITGLTPIIAPTVLFAAASGYVGPEIAFLGHWRKLKVHTLTLLEGDETRHSSGAPFRAEVAIDVGYPEEPVVEVTASGTTTAYSVTDLKASDARQIDQLLLGGDVFTSPSSISGCAVVRLRDWTEFSETLWRGVYEVEITEAF